MDALDHKAPKLLLMEFAPFPRQLGAWVLEQVSAPWRGGRVMRAPIDVRRLIDPRRNQLDAGRLLEALPHPPVHHVCVGLTSHDLFLPVLAYVSGLAPLGKLHAVASVARLGAGPGSSEHRMARLRARLLVEVVHEAGHAVGLLHCAVPQCVMHQSLSAEEMDLKDPVYCPRCRQTFDEAWQRHIG